jgi:hypothetical protein
MTAAPPTTPGYPTLGIIDSGLTHAARPDALLTVGFAPAMCRSTLLVSVEHVLHVTGSGWQTTPVRATADPSPTLDAEGVVVAEGVDCLRCSAALTRWEVRNHDAVSAWEADHRVTATTPA